MNTVWYFITTFQKEKLPCHILMLPLKPSPPAAKKSIGRNRDKVDPKHKGMFLVLNIETRNYEIEC